MFVTADQLEELGACWDSVAKFRELFPEGARVTIKVCVEHATEFDWDWAARNLLPQVRNGAVPTWVVQYHRAVDEAARRYERATANLSHEESETGECADCVRADAASERYNRDCAEAFARAVRAVEGAARRVAS